MTPVAVPAAVELAPSDGVVLLATDLGAASSSAEEAAVDIAVERSRPLVILSVIDPGGLRLPGGGWHARVDQVRSERERAALDLIDSARTRGAEARFMIWEGQPGESIVDAAQAEGAGVIVVGSHNRGRVGRFLLGSVSEHVVKHAGCPVVVIPSSGPDRPEHPRLGAAVQPTPALRR